MGESLTTGEAVPPAETDTTDGAPAEDGSQAAREASAAAQASAEVEMETYVELTGEQAYPQADVQLDAVALLTEFKADDDAFKEKYGDKIIDVTGTIDRYSSSGDSVKAMVSAGEGINDELWIELHQDRPWTICPPGSRVTIRGKPGGFLAHVHAAYIISHEPGQVLELDPVEAAQKYAEDPEGYSKSLQDQVVLIRGTLVEQTEEDEKPMYDVGTAEHHVRLILGNIFEADPIPWNPPAGETVAAYGEFSGLDSRPGKLAFNKLHPLTPLADYPPLPKPREQDVVGIAGLSYSTTVRPFTAELLGQWARENPRALALAFATDKSDARLLVTGEVASVEAVELLLGKGFRVRLADGHNNDVYFDLDEDDAAKYQFKGGDRVTVSGAIQIRDEGVTFFIPGIARQQQ
jgi:hypothetical protein